MDDPAEFKALAERDKTIVDMGHKLTREYVEETYQVEVDRTAPKPPPPALPGLPVQGDPGVELSEGTKARKRRNADKILTLDGYLRGHLVHRATSHSVEVGSLFVCAGTHQFGAEKGSFGSTAKGTPIPYGDIPARPFLGLSDADGDELTDILRNFIIERLG